MTTPTAMRLRAMNIRQAALGFDDEVSRTLIELAVDLERRALEMDGHEEPVEKPESP